MERPADERAGRRNKVVIKLNRNGVNRNKSATEYNPSSVKHGQTGNRQNHYTLLTGHRIVTGTVDSVTGDQAKVDSGNTGEITRATSHRSEGRKRDLP